MKSDPPKLISIVTPVFNEAQSIELCCKAVRDLFAGELSEYDYEHVICDNASTDGTTELLKRMADADPNLRVIVNNRNFGAVPSNLNGIFAACGDAILLCLPADMQDPPEMLVEFVNHWAAGYEVVCGVRTKRQEPMLMQGLRSAYYRLIDLTSDAEIPRQVGLFQLVDRKVVQLLAAYNDQNPFVRGMIADGGFVTKRIPYTWKAREHGKSKIAFYSLFDQALNGILYYTKLPMRLSLVAGIGIAFLSIVYAAIGIVIQMVSPEPAPAGIPTLIAALFFFSGIQLAVLGVLGEYVGAIYTQVRPRSKVLERTRLNFPDEHVGPSLRRAA